MLTIRKNSSSAIKHICTHCCILCSNDLFLPRSVPVHIPAEVGICLEVIFFFFFFPPAAYKNQSFQIVSWGGGRAWGWAPHVVTNSATAGNILVCEGTLQRLWTRLSTSSQFTWGWIVAEATIGDEIAQAGDTQAHVATARVIGPRLVPWSLFEL